MVNTPARQDEVVEASLLTFVKIPPGVLSEKRPPSMVCPVAQGRQSFTISSDVSTDKLGSTNSAAHFLHLGKFSHRTRKPRRMATTSWWWTHKANVNFNLLGVPIWEYA